MPVYSVVTGYSLFQNLGSSYKFEKLVNRGLIDE